MDWQLLIVGVLLLLALFYLGRKTLRTWRGKGAGCGTCKCGTSKTASSPSGAQSLIPVDQVRLRRR